MVWKTSTHPKHLGPFRTCLLYFGSFPSVERQTALGFATGPETPRTNPGDVYLVLNNLSLFVPSPSHLHSIPYWLFRGMDNGKLCNHQRIEYSQPTSYKRQICAVY